MCRITLQTLKPPPPLTVDDVDDTAVEEQYAFFWVKQEAFIAAVCTRELMEMLLGFIFIVTKNIYFYI